MSSGPKRIVLIEWLIRLRWLFLGGQALALGVASWRFSVDLRWLPIAVALTVYGLSNLLLSLLAKGKDRAPARIVGTVLILDTGLLTMVLGASGGAANPFTVLYLVHITLSAVVLSSIWTTAIALLSVAGFGALFLLGPAKAMHHMNHGTQPAFDHHLQGMWAAFVVATALTAYFVTKISRQLADQREQIANLRETNARNARLAALTTLAAGAAHELNSPLGTISVAAYEANRHSADIAGTESIAEDLRLILSEVDRCQNILHRMAANASEAEEGSGSPLTVEEFDSLIEDELGGERRKRVELDVDKDLTCLVLTSSQIVQSVVALIQNGLDASGSDDKVSVKISCNPDAVIIRVSDHGPGIPDDEIDKIGEPFFTTKEPGAGLGLGVFLARAVIESRGGSLKIQSTPGQGTCATVHLPNPGMESAA